MKNLITLIMSLGLVVLNAGSLYALTDRGYAYKPKQESAKRSTLNGIRMGGTYVWSNHGPKGRAQRAVLTKEGIGRPFVTQFGWQFEKLFGNSEGRTAGVLSIVALAGGFNQGVIIPSLTGIMGVRLDNGLEFGGGPNVAGTKDTLGEFKAEPGFAWTVGYSFKVGKLVLPINGAVVQSPSGARFTLLSGFIWDKRKS